VFLLNSAGGSGPPTPTAKFLNTFLRVTAVAMMSGYNRHFMTVLSMIKNKIVPKLSESGDFASHKNLLIEFLDKFIQSRGQECAPLV
jgi:hypothetical protein